jgi:hypothetical protein
MDLLARWNLRDRTIHAQRRVERGLRGARPRSLAKRFRRLLRQAPGDYVELVPAANERDPPTRVRRTESYLARAGRLTIEARQVEQLWESMNEEQLVGRVQRTRAVTL